MREKYKRRRGWIKTIAVDVETKQITYEVTDEQVHDNKNSKIEKSQEKARVKRVLADKAHDSYDYFEFLQSKGLMPFQ